MFSQDEELESLLSKAKSVQAIECPTCNILHRNVDALSACLKMHNDHKISREILEKYENFRHSVVGYFCENLMSLSPFEIGQRISEAGKLIGFDIIIDEVSFPSMPFLVHNLHPSTQESKKIMDLLSSCHEQGTPFDMIDISEFDFSNNISVNISGFFSIGHFDSSFIHNPILLETSFDDSFFIFFKNLSEENLRRRRFNSSSSYIIRDFLQTFIGMSHMTTEHAITREFSKKTPEGFACFNIHTSIMLSSRYKHIKRNILELIYLKNKKKWSEKNDKNVISEFNKSRKPILLVANMKYQNAHFEYEENQNELEKAKNIFAELEEKSNKLKRKLFHIEAEICQEELKQVLLENEVTVDTDRIQEIEKLLSQKKQSDVKADEKKKKQNMYEEKFRSSENYYD